MTDIDKKREEIQEGLRGLLSDELVMPQFTHEKSPPDRDCEESCKVLSNPDKKHGKCMDCWSGFIDRLVIKIQEKESGCSNQG